MRTHLVPPHALLTPYIQGFWITRRTFLPPNDTFDILPDSMVNLVFTFGPASYGAVANQEEQPLPACYVVGLLEQPVRIRVNGVLTSIRTHLYPWSVVPLLGTLQPYLLPGVYLPDEQVTHLTVSPELRKHVDPEQFVHALQALFIDRVLTTTLNDPVVVQAARQILEQQGNLDIERLAAATFLSPRTLRRRFGALLGVRPKQLARTARFEAVRDALWHNPDVHLAHLAAATGYADQAHLQREFRQFSQRTPRQFAAEMRQTRRLFTSGRNLQDS